MKNIILLVFFFGSLFLFSQEKSTFYLIFEEGAKGSCEYRPKVDKNTIINLPYIQKRYRKVGVTWFFICKQQFVFEFKTSEFKVISGEEYKQIEISTIEDLLNFRYQKTPTQTPHELVNKIYLLEAIENNQYAVYAVQWKDLNR